MGEHDEFIAEFIEECDENLDQLDQELVALEDNPRDPDRLASIFRNVHTIKGSSGFFGFVKLGALTHEGETLLGKIRDGELLFNQSIASGLLSMVDAIRELLAEIERSGQEGEKEYPQVLDELRGLLEAGPEQPPSEPSEAEPPAAAPTIAAPETPDQRDDPSVTPDAVDLPAEEPSQESTEAEQTAAKDSTPEPEADVVADSTDQSAAQDVESVAPSVAQKKPATEATSIRVDVALLDELMDFAGELVLARNALFQCNEVTENAELAGVTSRVSQITSEIQDRVMRTRMQPIGSIWAKFRRIVRDLSVSCGKQVRLELEGEETELDRSLLEAIRDPLTHIIRNAVDHGIEVPDVRTAAGKSPEGLLRLRARHESGQVIIEAIDDGGGINVDAIRKKAVASGIMDQSAAASASGSQILQCIFAPGFSTAKQVSAISGRGVGMDVVKSHIERIGGSVDLQSTLGKGTKLTIKIPLTLAIVPALMVGSAGHRFVIPQASLLEVITAGATSPIETLHNVPVYRLRDRLLPLVWLNKILGFESEELANSQCIGDGVAVAVLEVDGERYGLVVDEVLNTHEIVVKPIGASIKAIGVYSAATILGDGSVAMILDVGGIARMGGLLSDSGERDSEPIETQAPADAAKDLADRQQTLLVCDVGGGREVAIPLQMVERLEELSISKIKQTDSGSAVSYRGSVLPIVSLGGQSFWDNLPKPLPPDASVHVVVHRREDKLFGAAVQRIVDVVAGDAIVETSDDAVSRGPVIGMTLARGRVMEVLDLNRIGGTP